MIPIEQIEILNPRDRNEKVFAECRKYPYSGAKKPITVTRISNRNRPYQLICGEGRIKAFLQLGEQKFQLESLMLAKKKH
jgi:ParB family chromosome partitioning protein